MVLGLAGGGGIRERVVVEVGGGYGEEKGGFRGAVLRVSSLGWGVYDDKCGLPGVGWWVERGG